jgi:hypothetical protein
MVEKAPKLRVLDLDLAYNNIGLHALYAPIVLDSEKLVEPDAPPVAKIPWFVSLEVLRLNLK